MTLTARSSNDAKEHSIYEGAYCSKVLLTKQTNQDNNALCQCLCSANFTQVAVDILCAQGQLSECQ